MARCVLKWTHPSKLIGLTQVASLALFAAVSIDELVSTPRYFPHYASPIRRDRNLSLFFITVKARDSLVLKCDSMNTLMTLQRLHTFEIEGTTRNIKEGSPKSNI